MSALEKIYSFYQETDLEKGVIGKSLCGRDIFYIFCGNKTGTIFLAQYAIHAREYITAFLALEQIQNLAKKQLPYGVYFVPLSNPDGVSLCLDGITFKEKKYAKLLRLINGGDDFSLYKANARGVDLNVNFDARWSQGKTNIFMPSSENYVGAHPFSEPESQALRDFTTSVKPSATISYHSKGEEIYWYFGQRKNIRTRDYLLAKSLKNSTDYALKYTFASAGGYKDWCIEKLGIPSFTIEVGNDALSHPISKQHLESIYQSNKNVFDDLYKGYLTL